MSENKKSFAVMDENDIVVDSCIAEDILIVQALFPGKRVEHAPVPENVKIGGMFVNGQFTEPKPHDNWVLDNQTGRFWIPPVPSPTTPEGTYAAWNQSTGEWDIVPKEEE